MLLMGKCFYICNMSCIIHDVSHHIQYDVFALPDEPGNVSYQESSAEAIFLQIQDAGFSEKRGSRML